MSTTQTLAELLGPGALFSDGDWVESKDQDPSGDVRLIQLADVGDGEYLNKSARFLTSRKAAELRCTFLEPGDILVARMPDPLGRACLFPGDERPCVTVVDVCIVRPKSNLDRGWLLHAINSPAFRAQITSHIKGTTRQRISRTNLGTIRLTVPPLAEQRRIAAILEKADAVRRKRREAIGLTEELLRAAFLEMFGDVRARRSRYPIIPLRPYLSAASGKSSKGVLADRATDIPVYGGNGINGWATKALYNEPVVVVGRVGQQCGITKLTTGPSWVTDNAIVVNVEDSGKLSPVYLAAALAESPLRSAVERLDLPFINQSMILDNPLPLPPIAAQREFEQARERILSLHASLERALKSDQQLFASLLHRAFRGDLVAESP